MKNCQPVTERLTYRTSVQTSQHRPPTMAATGTENGISFTIFQRLTQVPCQVSFRSSVPGISHQSESATQIVSITSQSKNSAPRNST